MTGVSICISTYSGAHRLARLLDSFARGGVDGRDELLVFDDGSPNRDAVREITDGEIPRISRSERSFIRNEVNVDWVRAQSTLIAVSKREIVLLLDDDTLLPPRFMDTLRDLMTWLPNVGVLHWRSTQDSASPVHGVIQLATQLAGYCYAFRRSAYTEVGGLDVRFKHFCADSDLALRMTLAGHPCYRVWWPLVPHEGSACKKEAPELGTIEGMAARDLAVWNEKWGASGDEMERRALAGLVERASR